MKLWPALWLLLPPGTVSFKDCQPGHRPEASRHKPESDHKFSPGSHLILWLHLLSPLPAPLYLANPINSRIFRVQIYALSSFHTHTCSQMPSRYVLMTPKSISVAQFSLLSLKPIELTSWPTPIPKYPKGSCPWGRNPGECGAPKQVRRNLREVAKSVTQEPSCFEFWLHDFSAMWYCTSFLFSVIVSFLSTDANHIRLKPQALEPDYLSSNPGSNIS